MTGREWTLDLGEQRPLTLNGQRRNPYVHARAVKHLRRLTWALACNARIPRLGRVQVELHYAPRDKRRRDPMNLVATLKPCEDGVVDAGVIPDDTPEFSLPTVPVIDPPTGKRGRLYVIVRELVDKGGPA